MQSDVTLVASISHADEDAAVELSGAKVRGGTINGEEDGTPRSPNVELAWTFCGVRTQHRL